MKYVDASIVRDTHSQKSHAFQLSGVMVDALVHSAPEESRMNMRY